MKKEKETSPIPEWCTECKMNRTYFDICGKCQDKYDQEQIDKLT